MAFGSQTEGRFFFLAFKRQLSSKKFKLIIKNGFVIHY